VGLGDAHRDTKCEYQLYCFSQFNFKKIKFILYQINVTLQESDPSETRGQEKNKDWEEQSMSQTFLSAAHFWTSGQTSCKCTRVGWVTQENCFFFNYAAGRRQPSGRQNWRFDKIGYSSKTSHCEELLVHDLLQHLISAGEITKQGK